MTYTTWFSGTLSLFSTTSRDLEVLREEFATLPEGFELPHYTPEQGRSRIYSPKHSVSCTVEMWMPVFGRLLRRLEGTLSGRLAWVGWGFGKDPTSPTYRDAGYVDMNNLHVHSYHPDPTTRIYTLEIPRNADIFRDAMIGYAKRALGFNLSTATELVLEELDTKAWYQEIQRQKEGKRP